MTNPEKEHEMSKGEQDYYDAVTALDAYQAETGDPMSSPEDGTPRGWDMNSNDLRDRSTR